MTNKWYSKVYRRNLVDMHIEDWNEEFLSKFDPDDYFNNLVKAKIQSPMIYFQSHTGLCNFDTKVAKTHNAFVGDNKIKILVDKCIDAGMDVVGYYSVIYNTWAQLNHPEWAMRIADGRTHTDLGQRYGLCCPNNLGYREFLREQVKEMSVYYKGIKGLFYDMLFWPMPCQCDACKKRWEEEVGGPMPEKEDWNDERFKLHVKKMQEWMGEFATYLKSLTDEYFPGVTTEQNYASVLAFSGRCAQTELVNDQCEFAGGDLYGNLYSHSFCAKYYREITKNPPFEYMVCRCDKSLNEHTASKTDNQLTTELMLTSYHHGANFIIDAINPDGTLDGRVYENIGYIFDKIAPFEQFYEGEMVKDVGLFFDSKVKFNPERGYHACNMFSGVHACQTLIENHVPVSVIANGILDRINDYKLIVAGELQDFIGNDYEKVFLEYVKNGGNLYLSGKSNSKLMKEFFGAKFVGFSKENKTYINPNESVNDLFATFNSASPMPINYVLPYFDVEDKNLVKGTIKLPYTDPVDHMKYASIHSNPPGIATDYPSIMINNYGKGKVVWVAGAIEQDDRVCFKEVFMNIVNSLVGKDNFTIKSKLSGTVETTVFKTDNALILNFIELVNVEEKLKKEFEIDVKSDKKPKSLTVLGDNLTADYSYSNGIVKLKGVVENYGTIKINF